jgi:hypothetical protein
MLAGALQTSDPGRDVCRASNSAAMRSCSTRWSPGVGGHRPRRRQIQRHDAHQMSTLGGEQSVTTVSEGGLNRLISSRVIRKGNEHLREQLCCSTSSSRPSARWAVTACQRLKRCRRLRCHNLAYVMVPSPRAAIFRTHPTKAMSG